ncbi:RNA polymerase sigma factor [Draconibacterium sp. IB214405]|uniref:RNA polymerase sigma factor n=1 Tax=Draconibacterium sp. IB214405 TaxID=3097352 RepID=UPI002A0BB377|nr:RNA polymerase sigma factor [Draconibacterium sp. IB214405]MDX8340609.1 RNA polymerase sigma factor [Draconibacterium sp. IB214405]
MTKGDFKKLFDEHFEQVRSYLFFRSGDTELATDIAQETFLKIWEKQHFIDETRVKGLLFKIANDLFASYYRKEKRSFEFFKHYKPEEKSSTPEEALVFTQMKENYNQALERMPEKQRTVFLMSRVDQLTYNEIAEMVGVSVKAVEKRMKLALNFLRTSLRVNE